MTEGIGITDLPARHRGESAEDYMRRVGVDPESRFAAYRQLLIDLCASGEEFNARSEEKLRPAKEYALERWYVEDAVERRARGFSRKEVRHYLGRSLLFPDDRLERMLGEAGFGENT